MAEENTKGPTAPVAKSVKAPPQAVAAANAPSVANEAAAAVTVLEQRIVELEHAFEGLLTHGAASHPAVTGWLNKFRARLAATIAPSPEGISGGG
jgi:hypothetical protein